MGPSAAEHLPDVSGASGTDMDRLRRPKHLRGHVSMCVFACGHALRLHLPICRCFTRPLLAPVADNRAFVLSERGRVSHTHSAAA